LDNCQKYRSSDFRTTIDTIIELVPEFDRSRQWWREHLNHTDEEHMHWWNNGKSYEQLLETKTAGRNEAPNRRYPIRDYCRGGFGAKAGSQLLDTLTASTSI